MTHSPTGRGLLERTGREQICRLPGDLNQQPWGPPADRRGRNEADEKGDERSLTAEAEAHFWF